MWKVKRVVNVAVNSPFLIKMQVLKCVTRMHMSSGTRENTNIVTLAKMGVFPVVELLFTL
jgi:hypothetical protein